MCMYIYVCVYVCVYACIYECTYGCVFMCPKVASILGEGERVHALSDFLLFF